MRKRKRPCNVNTKKYISGHGGCGRWTGTQFDGLFHKWGSEIVENQDGSFISGTVGIVEDENGKIHTVNPEYITFTDK